jgi:DNA-binding transcriptional MerR regulator
MTTAAEARAASTNRENRLHTIGAVCERLKSEFPDISISKIRYLEDQGLLSLRRTPGGYRLFGEDDIERLETILRLQRDEFLPLRVIKQELSSQSGKGRRRRKAVGLTSDGSTLELEELCARAGITRDLARELEDFGLIEGRTADGVKRYREGDVEVALVCLRLTQYGMSPRHLRTFRTTADRKAALLEQLVAPALHARNPERRRAGLDDLQGLAELSQELSQLLFWRDLCGLAEA